jgi:hypothetical protein
MSDQERIPKLTITLILYEDRYSRVKMSTTDGRPFEISDAAYLLEMATIKLMEQPTFASQEDA